MRTKIESVYKEVYMDPFTDYGFKKLFGEEDSKEYLIDFLNSVFEGFIPHIHELNYHKNEHLGNKHIDRNAVFDLYCKSKDGSRFIIELQKAKQDYFKQRSLFYSTFAITEQAKKGPWDFKLSPVYCIGLLNFSLDNNHKKYLTKAKILDIETHQTVIEELNFAFIECPKFNKTLHTNSSKQDKWLYVLTHLAQLSDMPKELSEQLFEDFFKKANVLKLSARERARYNASITYYRDMHNIERQRLQEGEEIGRVKGEQQKARNIARAMKNKGLDPAMITELTGLSSSEIATL